MKTIIVEIAGGLVQDVLGVPKGVVVEIHDYDDAHEAEEGEHMGVDENGDQYFKGVWGHDDE